MAVNKNFVVKNGIEVNNNLLVADVDTQKVGIGTSVSSYELHVSGGIGATDLYVCGVTTLGSAGGITTTGGDLYIGGDLYVLDDVVYDEVTGRNIYVTGIATVQDFTVQGNSRLTGITTLASGGGITTTGGDFYVGGDLYVLDDIVYDEVTGRNLNITGVSSLATVDIGAGDISVAYLNVSGVATLPAAISMTNINVTGIGTIGIASLSDAVVSGAMTVLGNLDVSGDIVYDEVSGRNLSISGIATAGTMHVGVTTTATEELVVTGNARVTGILTIGTSSITLDGSNNDLTIGTGVTVYGNTGIVSAVTIQQSDGATLGTKASIGLAIALGG